MSSLLRVIPSHGRLTIDRWQVLANATGECMKVREVITRLEAHGWYSIPSKGGHRQFKHPTKPGRVTVAGKPGVDVPIKTLKSIWRQAGLPED